MPGGQRWYLLQTKVRAESRTAQRLGWEGYATALPLVAEPRRDRVRRTRIYTVQVPCFPGYVMVQLDLARDPLHPVVKCEGVKRVFMGADGRPVPFRRGEVEVLLARADAWAPAVAALAAFADGLAALAEGSRVRFTAGPFLDHEGVCLWSAGDRVQLLMELFGHAYEVSVPRIDVTAA